MRAARVEGAAGRQVAQQRCEAGNALHHPLALQRRQAGDQHLRVGMLRRGDDLADRRDLDQPAGVHHAEPIDELRHQAHVVADQDDRRAELLLHAAERLHHLALHHDVERAGRLVGDDHLGAQADGDGDADALLHAAGQLVRIHVRHLGRQADLAEQVAHARRRVSRGDSAHAVVGQRVGDLRADAQHRVERVHRALRHQRDAGQAQPAHRVVATARTAACRRARPRRRRCGRAGVIRRRMASAMVDLPEPDSPARPKRSCGRRLN